MIYFFLWLSEHEAAASVMSLTYSCHRSAASCFCWTPRCFSTHCCSRTGRTDLKTEELNLQLDLTLYWTLPVVVYLWRFLWSPACVSSPAGSGPGRPGRWLTLTVLLEWGRGRRSAEGWSWCSRFQPQTPDVRRGSAKSRCWCSVQRSKEINGVLGAVLMTDRFRCALTLTLYCRKQ